MENTIILIGPVGVGKSTIGKLISKKLSIPQAVLDDERWDIYRDLGFDFEYQKKLYDSNGFLGMYQYWKPFEANSVRIIIEKYKNFVIDFGAGQSVYEDKELFAKVEKVLNPIKNVILLLPSSDDEESLDILFKRNGFEHNDLFINSDCNKKLAKHIVYTKEKTPNETCDEIIRLIKL